MPAKKGKKRAKADDEERALAGGTSQKQKRFKQTEAARGMQKVVALRAELVADRAKLKARLAELDAREKELDTRAAKIAAEAAREEKKEAQRVANAKGREEARVSRFLSRFTRAPTACAWQQLDAEAEKLKHSQGMITTESQSRCILLLVIHCMKNGATSSEANTQVASTLRIGEKKVKAIRRAWKEDKVLLSSSGKERGTVKGQGDKRLSLDAVQRAKLGDFIGKEHDRAS